MFSQPCGTYHQWAVSIDYVSQIFVGQNKKNSKSCDCWKQGVDVSIVVYHSDMTLRIDSADTDIPVLHSWLS